MVGKHSEWSGVDRISKTNVATSRNNTHGIFHHVDMNDTDAAYPNSRLMLKFQHVGIALYSQQMIDVLFGA